MKIETETKNPEETILKHTRMISQKRNFQQNLLLKAMQNTRQKRGRNNISTYSTLSHHFRVSVAVFVVFFYAKCEGVHREELPSLLVINYNPPVSAAVSENQQGQVEVHTQLNMTDILTPNGMRIKADDPHYIPMWIRCPGRLTAVPEPSDLLDILNGTIDVVPEDFFKNVSTVLTLRGKKLGHVKLILYWELTNDSMCTELPEDIFSESSDSSLWTHDASSLKTIKPIEILTKPPLEPESLLGVKSSTATSEIETTLSKSNSNKFLKKKFVLVRPRSSKSNTRPPEENSGDSAISANIFGRRKRSVGTLNGIHSDRGGEQDSSMKIVIAKGYNIQVLREEDILDDVLLYIVNTLFAINILFLGVRIKLKKLKKIIHEPVGPLIVAVWQFLILPLVSYGLALVYFKKNSTAQFGLFALSCSPVAILSNSWAFGKKSDVNLSIMITFLSLVCSLFIMPLWLHTLGATLVYDNTVAVPYLWLFGSLLVLLISLAISMAATHFYKEVQNKINKFNRPISWIVIILISVLGIARCLHSLTEINWQLAIAGLIIACFGYIFGFITSRLFGISKKASVSITTAAAFQNPEIAFAVLQLTLRKPDSDLNSVPPMVQILFTSLPLILFQLCEIIMNVYKERNNSAKEEKLKSSIRENSSDKTKAKPLLQIFRSDLNTDTDSDASITYMANEPLSSELVNEVELNTARENDKRRNTFNTFGK